MAVYPLCGLLVSGAAMSLCGHTGDRRHWGEGRHFARDIDRKLKKCAAVTPTGISGMAWVDIQICAGSRELWSLLLTDLALIM